MKTNRRSRKTTSPAGVTLIEVAVSTVLVGGLLVASLETLSSAMRVTRETATAVDASALLGAMLAEAAVLPWEDPDGGSQALGQEIGELPLTADRVAVDDLDDLDGYSASPPVFIDGAEVPGYDGWTQRFEVTFASADSGGTGELAESLTDQGLRRVVCTATSPAGIAYQVESLRSRHGVQSTFVPFDVEHLVGCEAEVIVGTAQRLRTAIAAPNAPEAP